MMERLQKDNQCSTHEELLHAITKGITMNSNNASWKADSQYVNIHMNKWINDQNRIGWNQIINGRVAKSLTAAVSHLLRKQGIETWNISGEKWTRRLIKYSGTQCYNSGTTGIIYYMMQVRERPKSDNVSD
jgi:ribonuclease HI